MRIAFMHRQLSGGGTEADLQRMAAGLVARGHEVHVFCARGGDTAPGVRVRPVRIVRGGRLVRLVSFALAAPRAVAREAWDVVVGFGRTPRQDVVRVGGGTHRSYLARMEADGQRRAVRGPYHRAILWLEGRMFSPSGHRRIIAVSQLAAEEVIADYRVPRDHLAVLYNGVDGERFNPGRRPELGPGLRETLGIAPGVPVCAGIGSGFRRKGFDLLLALWRRSPPGGAVLLLVGDDERLVAWRRQVDEPGLAGRVVVTGPRPDVEAVLAAADVVCVPSRQEAFGNVVLEACAAGVPVVTSRRTGAAELLGGPLASLVVDDPESLDDLAAAIERALGPERANLGAAGRRLAESLPWDLHVDRVEALLAETARAR